MNRILRPVFALALIAVLAPASVARAQRDTAAAVRGDDDFYRAALGAALRDAREQAENYRRYVAAAPAPQANPRVAAEADQSIGESLAKVQRYSDSLRQAANEAGDVETQSFLDVIDNRLAAAADLRKEMRSLGQSAGASATSPDAAGPSAAGAARHLERVGELLEQALEEHGKLMLQRRANAPSPPAAQPQAAAAADSVRRSNVLLGVKLNQAEVEAVIGSVAAGSAAERAGLEAGDHVLAIDGIRVHSRQRFITELQRLAPGQSAQLLIDRGGKVDQIALGSVSQAGASEVGTIGVTPAETSQSRGVLIAALVPNGPADDVGLVVGDRILAVDGREVSTPEALRVAIHRHRPGDQIDLRADRHGWRRDFSLILVDRNTLRRNAAIAASQAAARRAAADATAANAAPIVAQPTELPPGIRNYSLGGLEGEPPTEQ